MNLKGSSQIGTIFAMYPDPFDSLLHAEVGVGCVPAR